jgi:MFS family permease
MLPFIAILFLLSRWSGGLIDRYGARTPLVAGPILAGAGFAMLALPGTSGSYWTTFFPASCVMGLGMAIAVAPLTTTVMNSVEARRAGIASGINNAVSRVAGLLAIAGLSLLMVQVFNSDLDRRLARLDLPAGRVAWLRAERSKLAAIEPPEDIDPAQRRAIRAAVDGAFTSGFRAIALAAAGLALAGAVAAWRIVPARVESRAAR